MTVKELIKLLQEQPGDALVVISKDSEGNAFYPIEDMGFGRYDGETFGLDELTESTEMLGYTEEDVVDGPIAICLWPE